MNYTKIHQSLRVRIVAFVANVVGVQFKIDGYPFGASYERSMWMQHHAEPRTGGPSTDSDSHSVGKLYVDVVCSVKEGAP